MKSRTSKALSLLLLLGAARVAPTAWAQPIVASQAINDNSTFTVSNTDLLQTNLASTATTGGGGFFSSAVSVLTDGTFGPAGSDFGASFARGSGGTITFTFDLTTNTSGYNLTQIDTYAGWGDNGLDGQEYTVSFATASSPTVFTDLLTIPQVNAASTGTARTLASITGTGGAAVASNVAAVRFTFTGFENGSTAYREIDVFGAAAVPEPATTALLLGIGALAVTAGARRYRRSALAVAEKTTL